MSDPPALELNSVRFAYPGETEPVVDIAHWSVARGERVFLFGPSGSGKSTLLGLLAGVHRTSGVRVLGSEMAELSASQRDRFRVDHIGLVFQQFNLIGYLSVAENIQLPCRFSRRRARAAVASDGSARAAALRLMDAFDLDAAMVDRPAQQLSIGQQQRVALARALIGEPEILLADEPTSALDAPRSEAFIDFALERCRASGTTLLLVSHDERLASRFDRRESVPSLSGAGLPT